MLALSFGLVAALIWAVHDLLARKVSQGAALLPILAVVLAAGTLALAPLALIRGDWAAMTAAAVAISVAYGLAYALAVGALYKAFSIAPVRLVSPVIGAYPMLSLVIALAQGRPVTMADWLAVLAIVIGIAIVARLGARRLRPKAMLPRRPSRLAGPHLARSVSPRPSPWGMRPTRQGAELPVMLIGRMVALVVVAALAVAQEARSSRRAGSSGFLR